MTGLTGKCAIVTGASRGAGKSIALRLAREGMALAMLARSPADLGAAVAEVTAAGAQVIGVPTDIADEHAVQHAVDETVRAFGRIDLLVNNAGVGSRGAVTETSLDAWQRVLATNLTGTFLCSRAVIPHMLSTGGGWIIGISSGAGKQGYAGMAAYCASKFGLIGFMQSLAAEVGDDLIKVSTICPGTIDTSFGKDDSAGRRPRPGAKYLYPDDLADAVVALLQQSDHAWTQEMNLWPFRD